MRNMTQGELRKWQHEQWVDELLGTDRNRRVNEVFFCRAVGVIEFRYGRNCRGLLFSSNGYNGPAGYEPLVAIHAQYCQYSPYSGALVAPDLAVIAAKIIELWKQFTEN